MAVATSSPHSATPDPRGPHGRRGHQDPVRSGDHSFRPDIQGLRAIAVSMVVVYHLYPHLLPGGFAGVDVFFVISGFLITGHLARGRQRSGGGSVRLLDFWGRRARRLLPAAALVLAVTWAFSRYLLPATQLPAAVDQIRASALYYQNWTLAHDAVNYLTSANAPSPVEHFWSLSVEEQFYLVWPFVFVLAALIGVRRRRAGRIAAFGLASLVVVASLVYSAHETAANPAAAYFITTTRMWELGLGGLLALLPGRASTLLGRQGWLAWAGLGMVVASAFVLSGSSAFPGTVALLPVGGAALLIACGSRAGAFGPSWLTSIRPMVFVGDISYSIYLWHWPIIVLWQAYSGHGIGYLDGPTIIAVSIVLAWLTKVFVEDRVRTARIVTRSPARSLATALAVLVPVGLVSAYSPPAPYHRVLDAKHPGAAVLAAGASHSAAAPALTGAAKRAKVEPSAAQAPQDFLPYSKCETPIPATTPRPCFYGDTHHPTLTVALVGDSVADQWRAALIPIAEERHWLLVTDFHGECPWTATLTARYKTSQPYTNCQQWGAQVQHALLTKYHPDVLITSDRPVLGTPSHSTPDATSFARIGDGMATYWRQLAAHGTKIVAIEESPEPHRNVPDCMSRPGATAAQCTSPASTSIIEHTPNERAVALLGSAATLVDMNPLICTPTKCPPIIGNVFVYRDTHHLTATYVKTLKPDLAQKLLATGSFAARTWKA